MPDFLSLYAQATPDKLAVVDDRPDGTILKWTFAELEARANQLGNVLVGLGAGPGRKVVWCGQNSRGIVVMVNAARKVGATAVPLNYRLSPEEAAYVTDHCDATIVYVDAEFAPLFEQIRAEIPKVQHVLVFDGPALDGMTAVDPLIDAAATTDPVPPDTGEPGATMIYTSGTTGKPKGALRTRRRDPQPRAPRCSRLIGYTPDDVYLTTGPLYHSGPGGFMGVAQTLGQTVVVQRKFDPVDWLRLVDTYKVTSTFSAPTPIRMICSLPADVKAQYDRSSMRRDDRQRGAVVVRAEADVPRGLPGRLALRGLRIDRARREHRARARGPAAQAGLVRQGRAGRRDRALRRRRQRRHGHRPRPSRRALRALGRACSPTTTSSTTSTRTTCAASTTRSATSRTATTRATSTSATARRT